MSNHPYHRLVQDFLKDGEILQEAPSPTDLGSFSFTLGDFTCEVYPDADETRVTVEVVVLRLGQLPAESIPETLRMLHHINWQARNETGIWATLSLDDEVIVSKTLSISQTTGSQLGGEIIALLVAARELQSILKAPLGEKRGNPAVAPDGLLIAGLSA